MVIYTSMTGGILWL